ncbi:MAG: response regulator, partial [Firmicutes bacterium]|nr:response regulator [Bacillota bacterium]
LTQGRGSLRHRLEPVLEWLRRTLAAEAVSLYWRRPGGGTIALLAKAGSLGAPAQLPLSSVEWRLARGARRVATCRDARATFGSLPATHPETRSLLVAAVGSVTGRPAGALVVTHRVAEWFDEHDAELVGPISSALGVVLAAHEQHAALERENRFRAAVVQVSSASATLQREARLFDLICWEAREAWRADAALLWLTSETNPSRLVCRMVSGAWPADLPSAEVDRDGPGAVAVAFREHRSVRSDDGRTLAHPLMAGAQAMGVLSLHYGQGLAEGYLTDVEGQAAFASLAASTIRSVRLLDASLHEEKVRALGTVAAGILHDVRNCLTPIVGMAELLLSASADERQRRGLELILAGARDAAATLDRIRRFAGLEPADGTQRVDLAEVCRQALELTRGRWLEAYQARSRRLEVTTDFARASPVEGSESELRQAVVNLILNALEAMPDGGRLTVSVGETGSGPFISVSDSGVGMDEETKRHIFEPFFTTKQGSGQGLGLMNLQMTVARHRGRVEVESTPGGGTTFTLSFPPASGGSAPRPGREPGDSAQAARPPGTGQACVLLVDDNEAVRRTLRAMLEADGHTVTEAASGEEALELLQQGRYDCVLADFALRGVSGLAVAEAAASAPGRPACIIVTGWDGDFDPALLKARNVSRILFKPVGVSELHEAVREAVRREPAGAS